jgi:hypothetical protein
LMTDAVVSNRLKEGNSPGETNNDFSASRKCCILGGKNENMGLATSISITTLRRRGGPNEDR